MNRQDLVAKLNQARPFLMNQEFIPILTHFCFDKETLKAYNDVAGISLVLDSDIHGAVPGNLMMKMVGTMKSETVRIEMKGAKNLEMSAGSRNNVKLPLLPPDEFIFELPDVSDATLVKLPLSFLKGLEKTLISIGDDPMHPERSGVTWKILNNEIQLFSTDSRSISIYKWKKDSLFEENIEIDVITPKFFCEQLISLAKNYEDELETVDLYFNAHENFVVADLNKICKIFTRLIRSDSNTDYESVIEAMLPDGDEMVFFEIPEDLDPALERAILLNSTAGLGNKSSYVRVMDNVVNIRTETENGISSDDIEFPAGVGDFEFNLDPELLERSFKYTSKISICPKLTVLNDDDNFTHLISYSG